MHHQISEEGLSEYLETIKSLQTQGKESESGLRKMEEVLRRCYVTRTCTPNSKNSVFRYGHDTTDTLAALDLSIDIGYPEGNFWSRKGNMWRCVSAVESESSEACRAAADPEPIIAELQLPRLGPLVASERHPLPQLRDAQVSLRR